jgi:hypothetical protein
MWFLWFLDCRRHWDFFKIQKIADQITSGVGHQNSSQGMLVGTLEAFTV